jgi:hypothetical protein
MRSVYASFRSPPAAVPIPVESRPQLIPDFKLCSISETREDGFLPLAISAGLTPTSENMKMKHAALCSLLLGSFALVAPSVIADPPRPLGDSKVLAPVPALPGYPEGIAVHEGLVYVSGPAAFGVPGNFMPSKIFAYDTDTGALARTITIQGQTGPLNAISCIAFGGDDNLFVVDEGLGILKINVETGHQSV